MNRCLARGFAALAVLFAGPAASAQLSVPDLAPEISSLPLPVARLDSPSLSLLSTPDMNPRPIHAPRMLAMHVSKPAFVFLSAGVYGAAFADMHQTLHNRRYSWWYETDPLAKPLIKLPAPAYYAVGLAMATGVNWLGWEMAHSHRWHKLSPIPQALAISGNLFGFHSNIH